MSIIESTENHAEFFFDPEAQLDLPVGDWQFMLLANHVRDGEAQPRGRVATTVTGLIGLVAVGYDEIDADDVAFMHRYWAAREVAGEVQAVFNAQAAGSGVDVSDPTFGLIWAEKSDPPEALTMWDAPVPLVLVRTDFDPFTDRPAPACGVVWIDPSTERELLETLDKAGFVQLAEKLD